MQNAVFQFELKHWLRTPLLYFFLCCYFGLALLTMLGTGGYFDGPISSSAKVQLLNAPFSLTENSFFFAKALLFLAAMILTSSLMRDYKNKMHPILYTFPLSNGYYLNGKLGSGLAVLMLTSLFTFLGIIVGEIFLGTSNPKIGEFNLFGYLTMLGAYVLPTLFIVGSFVFVAVGLTRNAFAGFIVVFLFFLIHQMLQYISFSSPQALALLDPFGQYAFQWTTQSWDFQAKNSSTLPLSWVVVFNRMGWLLLAVFALGYYYFKFNFQFDPIWEFRKRQVAEKSAIAGIDRQSLRDSVVQFDFSFAGKWRSFFGLLWFDFRSVIGSWMFWLLSGFGVATVLFMQLKVTQTGDFNLLPFTRILLHGPLLLYTLILIFSTFLFSSSLVYKPKQHKMDALVDATPTNNWQLFGSKIGAIALVQLIQLALFFLLCVCIQLYNGYSHFEISLYAYHLLVLVFPLLLVWNIAAHFSHTLAPNIFLSLFLLIGLWLGSQSLDQFGIDTWLLKFNLRPDLIYSDLSGYGAGLPGYYLIAVYWLVMGGLLLAGIYLFWNRGSLQHFTERWTRLKSRWSPPVLGVAVFLLAVLGWLGFQIHQQEAVNQSSNTAHNNRVEQLKLHKENWKNYSDLFLPKINNIDLQIDVFPSENRFELQGQYTLHNDTDQPIDTLLIRTGYDEQTTINLEGNAHLILADSALKSNLYVLKKTLAPNDSMPLSFEVRSMPNSHFSRNSGVLTNGTFLKHDILPRLGYQFYENELPHSDSLACKHNFYHRDADQVHLQTKISTSANQIALAPGQLITQTKKENRIHYQYKTTHPVKFNFSFHSGNFEVKKETYQGVNIAVYYAKGHAYNTQLMIDGIKAAFRYNTTNLGPYPYQQIRIIEFPHTEGEYSATIMANNVPSSEVLFAINSAAMEGKINLPFYVMAHELTHEWFGNQAMPASAAGAKMLTESLTEYLTLCIYTEHFGDKIALEFLKQQHKRYHRGRKREKSIEQPLSQVADHQQYIAYGKGAIVFNTLDHYLGRQKMNEILKSYLTKFGGHPGQYPTTSDFIQLMKSKTTADQHVLIDELLTGSAYYNNQLLSVKKATTNQLELTIIVEKKDGSAGPSISIETALFEVGQFDVDGRLLGTSVVLLSSGRNVVELDKVAGATSLVLDPNLLWIDLDWGDNRWELD